jgi:hypothetical protein
MEPTEEDKRLIDERLEATAQSRSRFAPGGGFGADPRGQKVSHQVTVPPELEADMAEGFDGHEETAAGLWSRVSRRSPPKDCKKSFLNLITLST